MYWLCIFGVICVEVFNLYMVYMIGFKEILFDLNWYVNVGGGFIVILFDMNNLF